MTMNPTNHTVPSEPAWDLRRGTGFEPPPGWTVVGSLQEGEGAFALLSPRRERGF